MTNNILFKTFITIIILLTTGYFAYHYYYNNKPVITIYPDDSPTKIKPQEITNTKSFGIGSTIYENLSSKKTLIKNAKLLPEPEKPINIDSRRRTDERIEDLIDELSAITQLDKITDLIVLNDNTKDVFNIDSKQESFEKPKTLANILEIADDETGLNIIKVNRENEEVRKIQNCEELGGYKVQLASVKSEAEALEEGARLKKKFIKILKDAEITTKKVKYDDGKFFYLVLAGNYKSLNQAKAVCKKLSYQQQNCVLK